MAPEAVHIRGFELLSQVTLESHSSFISEVRDGIFASIIFVPPSTRAGVVISSYEPSKPLAVVVNASEEHPEGAGYKLSHGTQIVLMPLHYVNDLYFINNERLKYLEGVGLRLSVIKAHNQVKDLNEEVKESLKRWEYSKFYNYSLYAWDIARGKKK